jgi:hypothetical protein
VLPFLFPAFETDATLRAAITESVQASVARLGSGALLTGGELSFDARAAGPRSAYVVEARAAYARAVDFATGGGFGAPADNLDAGAVLSATWTPAPLSSLSLQAEGSLATTYGMRAETALLERDPFLFAQRLEYAFGHDLSLSHEVSPRSALSFDAGYAQAGALAADTPGAVGVDTHELHAGLSLSRDLDPRTSIAPEVRYAYTHYQHALLDADFHRGPADIHTATLSTSASRQLAQGWTGTGSIGLSLGNAMPAVHAGHPVVAPDLGLTLRWIGSRSRLTARATYAYSSLGPRIGYGQREKITLQLDTRPVDGARGRDFLLRGTLRFAHGSTPLAADPEPPLPGAPLRPANGTLTATTLAAGVRMEIPIARGLAFTSGADLGYVRGFIAPAPAGGGARTELLATLTIGLAGTVSTDPHRTVPRDPDADRDEAARRRPVDVTPPERAEDRTRTSDEE